MKILNQIIIILGVIGLVAAFDGYLHRYTIENCKVIGVNNEVVTIVDSTEWHGIFDFCGEGFKIGDEVSVTFHDHFTDSTRVDDEIISVEKANY